MHDDFGIGVTNNCLAVFAALVFVELRNILSHSKSGTAISTNRTEDFNNVFSCLLVGVSANQFPAFVNKYGFALCTVLFDFRPDKVQNYEHRHGKQRAFHAIEVKYDVLGVKVHVGVVIEASHRTVN